MNNLSIITDRERDLAERLAKAEQQRDELKAALHEVAYANRTRGSMKQVAREAIAAQGERNAE